MSARSVMERPLDPVEMAAMNIAPTQVADFRGSLNYDLMSRAVLVLNRRHPVLRARVRSEGHLHKLVVLPDQYSELVILEGGEQALEREAKGRWDVTSGVARFFAVRSPGGGSLALRMDHSVMNGHGWTALYYELWQIYTDMVEGRPVTGTSTAVSLPRAPTDLLRERWVGFDESEFESLSHSTALRGLHQRNVVLSREETRRVVDCAKNAGESVHALICGAALMAQRGISGLLQPVRMGCISPVDLRNRVDPPVEATEVTIFHRGHLATVMVTDTDTAISVGHRVKIQLDQAVARNALPQISTDGLASPLEERLSVAMVSNLGRMRAIVTPAEVSITDWRRLADVVPMVFPAHATYTYADRLTLISYFPSDLFTAHDSDEISAGLVAHLLSRSHDMTPLGEGTDRIIVSKENNR